MGLGKTITLIALHLHRARPRPAQRADARGLPGLAARQLGARDRAVRARHVRCAATTAATRDLGGLAAPDEFVLTTYGTMRRDAPQPARRTSPGAWSSPTRPSTSRTPARARPGAARRCPPRARVALTGTPVENRPLRAVGDPRLDDARAARHARATFRERTGGADRARPATRPRRGGSPGWSRPFLLRRRKSDPGIAPELPPKTETDRLVALTREQAALYEARGARHDGADRGGRRASPAAAWC